MGCRCRRCGEHFVPPRPMCITVSPPIWNGWRNGCGRHVDSTYITIAPPFMMAQGYDRTSLLSGVVELDEGGRVDARMKASTPPGPNRFGSACP